MTGAAVATTIGRGVGCAYLFWYLFAGRGHLEFGRATWRFRRL